jgi:3-dehydroquinate dehydratase-2
VKLLIINGPNLNLLGRRKPEIYGSDSLIQINDYIHQNFPDDDIEFFQSNHEGSIIDRIVINPGAFAHYSYAIHDAIEACQIPVVEVHLSNISEREAFRRISVTAPACITVISGKGKQGYLSAISQLKERSGI